MMNNSGQKAS